MALYKENIVDIDLAKNRLHRSFLPHSIGTGDVAADRFGIRVFRSGEEVSLAGCSCFGYFRDPHGNNIALTSHGTIDGNLAYITLPQACYNYDGQFTLSIKLVGGGVTGTMRIVDGVVDNTNTGGAVAPTETVPTYTEVLAVYAQMQEAVEDYDETVTEQNTKIDNLKSALNEVTEQNLVTLSTVLTGKYITVSPYGTLVNGSTASQWEYTDYTDVSDYSKVAITAGCASSRLYYCFYDENKDPIANSGKAYVADTVLRDEIVDVPANAKYCVAGWYYSVAQNDPIIKGVELRPKANGIVSYAENQTLTDAEKETAIKNIGAVSENDFDEITAQKLTKISSTIVSGKYIDSAGAVVSASSGASQWEVTDYVDVEGIKQVAITATSTTSRMYYAFYNSSKVYIPNSGKAYVADTSLTDYIVDVPSGAKYCVAMWYYTTSANDPIIKRVGLKPDPTGLVEYDAAQTLTDEQKSQARTNIGAAAASVETSMQNIIAMQDISFTDNYFINQNDGKAVGDGSNRYAASDYIDISAFKTITFPQYYTGANAGVAFYNRKYAFTHSSTNPGTGGEVKTISIQNGDCYVRFSCLIANKSSFYLKTDDYIANAVRKVAQMIEDDRNDDSLFSKIIHDGGFTRIFDKIGVVGDSLSSGAMVYGAQPGQSVDMHYYSWIQYLARACGTTAYNFSQSGLSTRGFLNDLGGWKTKLLNPDYKCKAYFIALAHNDSAQEIPVGEPSDIDVSDPSQSADTFYGDYAKIIGLIKSVQPNAKIFCVCSKLTGFAAYNVAIRYMETVFDNVYTLDFETYYPTLESSWEYTNGHGNAMGYLNYSWQIGTYVDWIIRHNKTDFKYVQFIGTDYDEYIPTSD